MEPSDTLHGQLQRGRGAGYRRALADPGAADLVYDCIRHDPRHDRQVESRRWYLSRLVTALNLSAAPIAGHLLATADPADDDEWRIDLACGVLVDLAVRGDGTALAALREYVAHGRHRRWALATMAETDDPAGLLGVASLAPAPAAVPSRGRSGRGAAGPSEGPMWTDAGLADRVRTTGARAALVELGRRRAPVVLDLAEEPGVRTGAGALPGLAPALRILGAAAVPRARAWLAGADPFLARHGADVLAGHGDATDGPALLRVLADAADREDWCAAESPARGLARLRIADAAPVLRRLWAGTGHSYARTAFLVGILGTAPYDADRYLDEAADDCEPAVRDLAATHGATGR